MSRTILDTSKSPLDAWGQAILDAEKMIQESKSRIIKLRQAIKTFKRLRDSGEPWPGTSEATEKGAHSSKGARTPTSP